MVEQERPKGTARVLTGNFEFRDGNAAEVAKRALLEAGFDLDIEEIRENGYMVGERIKVYRKEVLPECIGRRL
ncbi:hypothetical protein ACG0Z4_20915 [Enterocloster aldenensis]|uniref:hypothetical protein n=1 Tax=Enterocloster aldenensis TaxID=358742 RepID=UPI0040270C4D